MTTRENKLTPDLITNAVSMSARSVAGPELKHN